jgi:hypothetical protein
VSVPRLPLVTSKGRLQIDEEQLFSGSRQLL